jgi:hypothetical protein
MNKFIEYVETLDKKQKKSLFEYTSSCTVANTLVRRGKKLVGKDASIYSEILKIFINGPKVKEPLTVYRGVNEMDAHNCKDYSGFISTTMDKGIAKDFSGKTCCFYKILVPPGDYSVLPLKSISEFPEEEEILLAPGSIQITGKDTDGSYTCVYIHNANVKSFDYSSSDTNRQFRTIDEWVDKLKKDVSQEDIDKAGSVFKTMNIGTDFTLERFGRSMIISTLSNLRYFNDIPEEAMYKYTSTLSLPGGKRYLV